MNWFYWLRLGLVRAWILIQSYSRNTPGISCYLADAENLKKRVGSPGYAAPEMLWLGLRRRADGGGHHPISNTNQSQTLHGTAIHAYVDPRKSPQCRHLWHTWSVWE